MSLSKLAQLQSTKDAKRYILLDELDDKMARKKFYVLVNLTDKVMGIGQSGMPYARDHSISCKNSLIDQYFNFLIGMFRYRKGENK